MSAQWLQDDGLPRRGEVVVIEAQPGQRRSELLEIGVAQAEAQGAKRSWLLNCSFRSGGVWAGVQELFSSLVEEIRRTAPELIVQHDHELLQVLPELQDSLQVRFPTLTDLSSGEEKVRGYPADRAFRSIHGLINLLAEWKPLAGGGLWVIACNGLDEASHIGLHFFRELARRRLHEIEIAFLIAVCPGEGERIKKSFAPHQIHEPLLRFELPHELPEENPGEIAAEARELDLRVSGDKLLMRRHLPEMIQLWEKVGDSEKLLKWNLFGLEICTESGLYEDALVYGKHARRLACQVQPEDGTLRWLIFFKLFSCHMALRDPWAAMQLAEEDALGKTERPEWRSQLYYLLAMLHSRYLPERDFEKAEAYLERGLEEIEGAALSEDRRHFGVVFNRNGLAMIRHFQGRYQEAIDICRSSFDHLSAHLHQDRHRLHRSVLLYNLAQVYSAIGCLGDALTHYSAAIAMDPNYSEYYNDRGGLLLRMGHLEAALADYRKAILLSPPYFEAYTNLGQCYRRMGREQEAEEAYSKALDLEPRQPLAFLGRAQAWEVLGETESAISDYKQALELAPDQWEAYANRAVLLYEAHRLTESLADLNNAMRLAPDQADLHLNRALVFGDLGLLDQAAEDLDKYLALRPEAPDRFEIAERLSSFRLAAVGGTGNQRFA